MRSEMLVKPQAREALALRGGDQRRAGMHPYGGSGRGVVSAGRAALPEPFAVRCGGSWGAKSYNESVSSGAAALLIQFDVGKRPAAKESGVKVLIFFQPVI